MKVSILCEKEVKAIVLGPETSETENKEASERKYNLVFTSPEELFGSHRSSILALKNKIQAVFIDEDRCGEMVMQIKCNIPQAEQVDSRVRPLLSSS